MCSWLAAIRLLPRNFTSALNVFAEHGGEVIEDFLFAGGEVGCFVWVGLKVVEFKRSEGAVLEEFPVASNESFDGLASVGRASFAADEVEITFGADQEASEEN